MKMEEMASSHHIQLVVVTAMVFRSILPQPLALPPHLKLYIPIHSISVVFLLLLAEVMVLVPC